MLLLALLPEIASFLLFIFSAVQRFDIGVFLVLGQFALAGALFIVRPLAFIETVLRWWPLLLMPILCVISALWSSAPAETFRYAAQLLFSAFLGVHLARLMTPARFATIFLYAMFVFCVLSVLDNTKGPSAEGPVLIGLTGSKNQMGFAAMYLLLAAVTALFLPRISVITRWVAILAVPVAAYIVYGSHAATALLMAVAGVGVLCALWFSQRLPPNGRLATVLGALLVLAPLSALTPEAVEFVNRFMFETLNKDPTLTGRTILWARADELIAQKPILGWGYQAIWMSDSIEAIGLKRLTGVTDGRTFHFHHQFRQVGVDTGLVGLFVFVCGLVFVAFNGLKQALLRPHPATSLFMVLFALTVARAMTDTVLTPLTVHTMLFFSCCVYAFWQPARAPDEAAYRAGAVWPPARHPALIRR
jgi:exopolysaccharide production protein ExoQ